MHNLLEVIERARPLIIPQIEKELKTNYRSREEKEACSKRLEELGKLYFDEILGLADHIDYSTASLTLDLYETVLVSDEQYEKIFKRVLELCT